MKPLKSQEHADKIAYYEEMATRMNRGYLFLPYDASKIIAYGDNKAIYKTKGIWYRWVKGESGFLPQNNHQMIVIDVDDLCKIYAKKFLINGQIKPALLTPIL